MMVEGEHYLAFMLRFRRDNSSKSWRATLANPQTGEQHSFANLDNLFQFLDERLAQSIEPAHDAGDKQPRRLGLTQ
jgi:hypothetical protein